MRRSTPKPSDTAMTAARTETQAGDHARHQSAVGVARSGSDLRAESVEALRACFSRWREALDRAFDHVHVAAVWATAGPSLWMNYGLGITSSRCRSRQVTLHRPGDPCDKIIDAGRPDRFDPQLVTREREPHQVRGDQLDAQ